MACDWNVRPEEEDGIWNVVLQRSLPPCRKLCLRDAQYAGVSWDPMKNRFFTNLDKYNGPGFSFDRVLVSGCLRGAGFLAGHRRTHFSAGWPFCLSDHYAVWAVVDLSDCLGDGGASKSTAAAAVRARVGAARDVLCLREKVQVTELEQDTFLERVLRFVLVRCLRIFLF